MAASKARWAIPEDRVLQVFAFAPSLNLDIGIAPLNRMRLRVPYEKLGRGPVGEYLEVVDVDPASGGVYEPVDLDDPFLLAQDGIPPSEGTPEFHQQMVYAVASRTIRNFELALGRPAMWSPNRSAQKMEFVKQLRLYPHALREANAYYDPAKKAILFGYFPASIKGKGAVLPGGTVFACLSHDIIVHETTHALLDGMHPYFNEPSNPDVLALHEAFADICALFEHFSDPDILRGQVARTRGDLATESLLAQLAQEFGQAIGGRGALRDALGSKDEAGVWKRKDPDPELITTTFEPHRRGSILVAAIFDAFLAVYQLRTADLKRIASSGSGVLAPGAIHPDLANRLASEAARISHHLLIMCIRALDYCTPVDVTFGEYLRAVVTADYDMDRVDADGYRIALIESFRRHGVYPSGVRDLSQESLLWHPPTDKLIRDEFFAERLKEIREFTGLQNHAGVSRENMFNSDTAFRRIIKDFWVPELFNRATETQLGDFRESLHLYLSLSARDELQSIVQENGKPVLEVSSVRPAFRIGPDGLTIPDLVIEMHQLRDGYLDEAQQNRADRGTLRDRNPDFVFRGGVTFLVSTETGEVRFVIGKRVGSNSRLERQRRFLRGEAQDDSLRTTYFGSPAMAYFRSAVTNDGRFPVTDVNLFALVHRSGQDAEASNE
jgi:hypothetical protein